MNDPHHHRYVYPDLESLSQKGAEFWLAQAEQVIRKKGQFNVALTGGNTPVQLYRLLASEPLKSRLDWQHVQFFIGDERVVPLDHPDSNFRMVCETLLDHLPINQQQLFPVPVAMDSAADAAQAYAATLKQHLPCHTNAVPEFDLVMLGMGEDGHTASLFPGTTILMEFEQTVAAVYVDKLSAWRVSLTYPVINQARVIMVLASGQGKARVLGEIFNHEPHRPYPIEGIKPVGQMHWFIDEAAAKYITNGDQTA